MKRFILTSAEPVLLTLPEESFYSVPGGKSSTSKKETGCNCGVCDVWNKNGLKDFYYCIKGSAE
jgi:hypothetical protein